MYTRFIRPWRLLVVLTLIVFFLITPACFTVIEPTPTPTPTSANTPTPTLTTTATATPTPTPNSVTCMLTIAANGNGIINPSVGVHAYNAGTVVNITATPASGWSFDNWSGDVANANLATTTLIISSNKTVTAKFSQIIQESVALYTLASYPLIQNGYVNLKNYLTVGQSVNGRVTEGPLVDTSIWKKWGIQIKDPAGNPVVQEGGKLSQYPINFTATQTGYYSVQLWNSGYPINVELRVNTSKWEFINGNYGSGPKN